MGYLQVRVGVVVVADEAQPIIPNGHRSEVAHIPIAVKGGCCGLRAFSIRSVGYLQVFVVVVEVADEA